MRERMFDSAVLIFRFFMNMLFFQRGEKWRGFVHAVTAFKTVLRVQTDGQDVLPRGQNLSDFAQRESVAGSPNLWLCVLQERSLLKWKQV